MYRLLLDCNFKYPVPFSNFILPSWYMFMPPPNVNLLALLLPDGIASSPSVPKVNAVFVVPEAFVFITMASFPSSVVVPRLSPVALLTTYKVPI